MNQIDNLSINTIRILSADAVQKAKSGHPGLPLGCASIAYELWARHMNHNPADPDWLNRDRFVLSAGHGSMLLYSLLYLYGYGNLTLEDLKEFRQLNSKTPGHPEYRHTVGVEATTGPLGAGMGMAVGMAIAEKHLASIFNKEGYPVIDHYTFALGGDGCMMEGISSEALSLAGTLGLSKLIVLYDSNNISIEGSTDLAFTEDVEMRMKAFGFQTLTVEDGNDIAAIGNAIEEAKADKERPSFIKIHTEIGYGCPNKQGKASAHGEPLGEDNVKALRENLQWPSQEPFYIPDEVYENYRTLRESLIQKTGKWGEMFEEYCIKYPEMKELIDVYFNSGNGKLLENNTEFWKRDEKPEATRNISGRLLNMMKDIIPNLIGGSADLAPSNKTYMEGMGDFSKENPAGRNIRFGVRELAMGAIGNGITLHGGLHSYVATFLVFSDYVKPMARLSSIMRIPATYVYSHDSIGVGEDGPTHEPIEQLAMLRAMPNMHVFRPCDAVETAAAWYSALTSKETPTTIVITRQNLAPMQGSSKDALKGGYILEDCEGVPDIILIATGSEVELAVEAGRILENKGRKVRVVSMPCMDIFEEQSEEYKEAILPKAVTRRVAIEALATFGWERYVGLEGKIVGMTSFGASGPYKELFEYFGITADEIVKAADSL
ncbi:transketolase [Faecalicatena contorta]|uniref:Transketolase n=1 Tax=Faecalicatena contorta TaxID=39482 RepID=A0A316A3U3_9FIRM|nr:transketolase [Faecalicatena contorta]PWJ51928.1 transketolase [Faecalicatena contorta]SUQ12206.1 transketolase [Faecalicatena contorta]